MAKKKTAKKTAKKSTAKKKVAKTKKKGAKKKAKKTVPTTSAGFTEVIGRALIDNDFRATLFSDRDTALADFDLSPCDIESLEALDADSLEAHAERLTGGRTAITIAIGISKSF